MSLGLINKNINSPGVFKSFVLYDQSKSETRIFIPGIHKNPLNSDGSLNIEIFDENSYSYPKAIWLSNPMRDAIPSNKVLSAWVSYEIGDESRPVILGYLGNALDAADAWSGGTSGFYPGGSASAIIEKALEWAIKIAQDDTHKYSQSVRWGPHYDCSSFVISAFEQAGCPVKTKGATATGTMKQPFIECGFEDVIDQINIKTGEGLIRGDVLLRESGGAGNGHTALVQLDGGTLVHAANSNEGIICNDNYYYANWNCVLRLKVAPQSSGTIHEITDEYKKYVYIPSGAQITYDDLRYVEIPHYDFNNNIVTGAMIVNKNRAEEVVKIFSELLAIKYPIERMKPITEYNNNDFASIDANNTSAFCYRLKTDGSGKLSKHALGRAIDINPQINPYVKSDGTGSHSNAKQYWSRNKDKWTNETAKAAYIGTNTEIYKIFKKYGWTWGGDWADYRDYQHFEKP